MEFLSFQRHKARLVRDHQISGDAFGIAMTQKSSQNLGFIVSRPTPVIKRLINSIRSHFAKPQSQVKPLPAVQIVLIDYELQKQDDRRKRLSSFDEANQPPLGLEFKYKAYNDNGDEVCFGLLVHIPGVQLNISGITTVESHRLQGYASSTILELSRLFEGLPIVPSYESNGGFRFWASARKRFAKIDLVKQQIAMDASTAELQKIIDSKASRDYTPNCIRNALKRVQSDD